MRPGFVKFPSAKACGIPSLLLALCFCICLFPALAFADEASETGTSETENQQPINVTVDVSGLATEAQMTQLIEAVGNMPSKSDIEALKESVEANAPIDSAEKFQELDRLLASLHVVVTFCWITSMLMVGIMLVIIFLNSYRSHT